MDEDPLAHLVPSEDDIKKILSEVTRENLSDLPRAAVGLFCAKMMAKHLSDLQQAWTKAVEKFTKEIDEQ